MHPRSTNKPSQKQMKWLAMARAREAAVAGKGTRATHKGQEGVVVGCWFVYNTGYVSFLAGGETKSRNSVYSDDYIKRVQDWNGCSRNKAIVMLEGGYRLPERKKKPAQ